MSRRTAKLTALLAAIAFVVAACSDPFAGDDSEPNVTIAGPGAAQDADPVIVDAYLSNVSEHPAVRTLSPQLALERLSLGADLLVSSVPVLQSCATQEVQADLSQFEQSLPSIQPIEVSDDEFVRTYGYGIGLLSYYDLAIQAADPLFGGAGAIDAYADCDLSSLENEEVDSQLAAIDAVLSSQSFLAVTEELQPQLGEWRSCLDATPADSELVAFPGFEDLEMMARATFDEVASDYFDVLSELAASGASYDDLLAGSASLSADDAALAERLVRIQATEIAVAEYDQSCFDEHVGESYGAAWDAELQRLQRDWPNL